jgi:tRNA-dihydrouridine synthase
MIKDIYFAPIQGFTDYVYRNAFVKSFGGVSKFFTPFIRIENGEVRKKDVVDLEMSRQFADSDVQLVPQIIANSGNEVDILVPILAKKGFCCFDINFGCPYPQQTSKNRGAGILPHPDKVAEVLLAASKYPDLSFSVKMRLGYADKCESLALVDIINSVSLRFVTIHPRVGKQMYAGALDMDAMDSLIKKISWPIVFNGDICSINDIIRVNDLFPNLHAVMIGRGLLANPFIAECYQKGEDVCFDRNRYIKFLEILADGYMKQYGSEYMVLDKMKTFWGYPLPGVNKKHVKAIQKVHGISEFFSQVAIAVNML